MNENNNAFYPSYMFEFIHHPEYGCHDLKGLNTWFDFVEYITTATAYSAQRGGKLEYIQVLYSKLGGTVYNNVREGKQYYSTCGQEKKYICSNLCRSFLPCFFHLQ
jgi:hypothetical protein